MSRRAVVAKSFGATAGALLLTMLVTTGVLAFAPMGQAEAFALAAHLVVPLWAALACALPLLGTRW